MDKNTASAGLSGSNTAAFPTYKNFQLRKLANGWLFTESMYVNGAHVVNDWYAKDTDELTKIIKDNN